MVKRLAKHGHECVVFDMSSKVVDDLAKGENITGIDLGRRPDRETGPKPRGLSG